MSAHDLFSYRDEIEATARVLSANEAWAEAQRKARVAPHGQKLVRQARLQAAFAEVLRAELELKQIQASLRSRR